MRETEPGTDPTAALTRRVVSLAITFSFNTAKFSRSGSIAITVASGYWALNHRVASPIFAPASMMIGF